MSASSNTIQNATDIIDRFGGIRPMASKINVAVTTVQGWKKRDAIPGARLNAITNAAAEHNIDLSDLLANAAPQANENTQPAKPKPQAQTTAKPVTQTAAPANNEPEQEQGASIIASMLHDDVLQQIKKAEGRAVTKSTFMTILLIGLTVAGLGVLLLPTLQSSGGSAIDEAELARLEKANLQMAADIATMKADMESIKDRQGFFGQIIPDDLGERLSSIKEQAMEARDSAAGAIEEARTLANDQAEALQGRLKTLEDQINQFENAPMLGALVQRYEAFSATSGGQDLLQNSTAKLANLLQTINPQDDAQVNQLLDQARNEDANLGQSFEGVPPQDLKAAALLMTMTQMRSSLNREGQPFANDLEVLKSLVGEDNPALVSALDRLAPHAQSGVLTPSGLSSELKTITGDVVVASLKGEDVSFADRAKARMNQIFKLEKEGELLTGTPTQATLTSVQNALDQGDLETAIAQMQTLDGETAKVVAPWIEKAQAAQLAEALEKTLGSALQNNAISGSNANRYTTGGGRVLVTP